LDANDGNGGTAVRASSSGIGLDVSGKIKLSRSGKATVAKKHSTLTVTVPSGIDTTSMVLVTLQGSGGSGVYLKYAKRMTATTFKVALNKKATAAVTFAWMILD
jgi:selenophosphate synthase